MSLLSPVAAPTLTPDQVAAQRKFTVQRTTQTLLATPARAFAGLLSTFENSVSGIWDDPHPEEILAALGTHGAELFQLSATTAAFLESLRPGCTAAVVAKIKPTSIAADGTVTISSAAPVSSPAASV